MPVVSMPAAALVVVPKQLTPQPGCPVMMTCPGPPGFCGETSMDAENSVMPSLLLATLAVALPVMLMRLFGRVVHVEVDRRVEAGTDALTGVTGERDAIEVARRVVEEEQPGQAVAL